MDEVTRRAPLEAALGGPRPAWLELLCPSDRRSRISALVREASVLRILLESWSRSAHSAVVEYEAGFEGQQVPDEAFAAIAELTGLSELTDLAAELADLCSAVSGG